MKIVALQSENVKRLRAVHIKPDGSLVVIKGDNGAGKSSVLDSIAYALGGEKLCPPQVIRRGQTAAEVTLDLGEYTVTRRWTAAGSTLVVKSPEGARYPSPQAMLDKLVGRLSFDPLAFTRAEGPKQVATLQKLAGVDFAQTNAKRKQLYDERTLVNRDATTIRGSLARMPEVEAPDEPVSVKALLDEQTARLATQRSNEAKKLARDEAVREVARRQKAVGDTRNEVARIEKELADAKKRENEAQAARASAETAEKQAQAIVEKLVTPDLDDVRKKLAEAEGINAKVRAKKARAETAAKLEAKDAEAKKLTAAIDALDQEKQATLAGAKFPVEGLSFTEEGVTFTGLPLEQASAAEQLRVSLAVGIALNPELKVILIRDASLLDEKSLALVAKQAEEAGAQVWVEIVGKGGPAGILIEDGAVDGVVPESKVEAVQ